MSTSTTTTETSESDDNDNDSIDYESNDEWSLVIQYKKRTFGKHVTSEKESIMCPECYGMDQTGDHFTVSIHGPHSSSVYTNGSVTVCANDGCDYHIDHGTQIKTTQFDDSIGPFCDHNRERYEHNERVILNGGFPHAHDYGHNHTAD